MPSCTCIHSNTWACSKDGIGSDPLTYYTYILAQHLLSVYALFVHAKGSPNNRRGFVCIRKIPPPVIAHSHEGGRLYSFYKEMHVITCTQSHNACAVHMSLPVQSRRDVSSERMSCLLPSWIVILKG